MRIFINITRFLLGGLFIFSGLIKINDPVGTAIKLEEYFQVFASDFSEGFLFFLPYALPVAVFLNVFEVALGVAVWVNYKMKVTSWLLLLLILFFTFLTFYSAYFNSVTDCGCFGDAIRLTPWQSFYKDLALFLFIGIVFFHRKKLQPLLSTKPAHMLMIGVIGLNLFLAFYAIAHLPFIDFRSYKVGADIPQLMQPSGELRYKYIMEKEGKLYDFEEYPMEPEYTFKEMILLNPEVQPKITDFNIWNAEGDFTESVFKGAKLVIIIHNAEEAHTKRLAEIGRLITDNNIEADPMVWTASDEASFETFRHQYQLAAPYYFADATVLKTIIRANPGIILLKDGIILAKWHYNDMPDSKGIRRLLEE